MEEQTSPPPEASPEAAANFVVIIQGNAPQAVVVEGLDGVARLVQEAVLATPTAVLQDTAAAIGTLRDPDAWRGHGVGDGRPYWHWWFGYEGSSVTVQRLTAAPLHDTTGRLRAALAFAISDLADSSRTLRRLGGVPDYVFKSRGRRD
jgi:hypothetical protein